MKKIIKKLNNNKTVNSIFNEYIKRFIANSILEFQQFISKSEVNNNEYKKFLNYLKINKDIFSSEDVLFYSQKTFNFKVKYINLNDQKSNEENYVVSMRNTIDKSLKLIPETIDQNFENTFLKHIFMYINGYYEYFPFIFVDSWTSLIEIRKNYNEKRRKIINNFNDLYQNNNKPILADIKKVFNLNSEDLLSKNNMDLIKKEVMLKDNSVIEVRFFELPVAYTERGFKYMESSWFSRSWKWLFSLVSTLLTFVALIVSTILNFTNFK